jgi:hypothetical protein
VSKSYTTVSGDMWDDVAYREMGSADYAGDLMWANRAHIDLYEFPAGIELTIPQVSPVRSGNLPPWKK